MLRCEDGAFKRARRSWAANSSSPMDQQRHGSQLTDKGMSASPESGEHSFCDYIHDPIIAIDDGGYMFLTDTSLMGATMKCRTGRCDRVCTGRARSVDSAAIRRCLAPSQQRPDRRASCLAAIGNRCLLKSVE